MQEKLVPAVLSSHLRRCKYFSRRQSDDPSSIVGRILDLALKQNIQRILFLLDALHTVFCARNWYGFQNSIANTAEKHLHMRGSKKDGEEFKCKIINKYMAI